MVTQNEMTQVDNYEIPEFTCNQSKVSSRSTGTHTLKEQ